MVETVEKTVREERVEAITSLADELGRQPLQREIAERLGVSMSYASSLVNDPDGSKDRERKRRYAGVCASCGGPTSGGEGRAKAPKHCIGCVQTDPDRVRVVRPRRIWNEAKCEDAIVAWVWEHRRIPRTIDFTHADPPRRPCLQTIMRHCYRYEEHAEERTAWSDEQLQLTWNARLAQSPRGETYVASWRQLTRTLADVLVDLAPRLPVDAIVAGSRNATVRARLFEVLGIENIVRYHGARIGSDDYGTLWRLERPEWPEAIVMVEVLNSTPEPDGTFKDYFLRVPPHVETAKEAVAWTFGMAVDEYEPAVET